MASITRSVLSDQVRDFLLQAVLSGRYPPGSRIVETRVARELGISQAPVREALRDLEAVGIVEITAFQGARVRRPEKAELSEAYGVRAELESLGARLAVPVLGEADIAELQDCIDEIQVAASVGDTLAEARLDAMFHARVIEIAGNTTLERVWRYLEPMSRTYITFVAHEFDRTLIADLHQPIVDALARRDAEAAAEAVRRHFRIAGEIFEQVLEEDAALRADPDASTLDGTPRRARRPLVTPIPGPAVAAGPDAPAAPVAAKEHA